MLCSNFNSAQRETLQRLKSELNDLECQRQDKQATLKAKEQAIVRFRRESTMLRIAVQSAESIVEELQDALDRDAVEEGRLDALKEHLVEAKEEVAIHEGSYEDSVVALDKARELMQVSRAQMAGLDAQIAEIDARVAKADGKAIKLSAQREGALRLKNSAIDSIEKAENNKVATESKCAEQVKIVAEFIEEATAICARVPVDAGETGDSIERKLKKLEADLHKYEAK